MNPILYVIYQYLKLLTKISFRVFYPNATLINLERLRYRGGSILVSNHPNTLLDPLNAACRVPKVVHFLANAGLFQTPLSNWFFSTFFCIPVERPEDTKGKPINNANAFRKSQSFISDGGCLFIAPEGGSYVGRRIRPFKTGTARILLGAAAQQNFENDLRILPVALSYDNPDQFRSHMTVNAAPPILAKDYAGLYQEDKMKAARKLTKDLEQIIRDHAIDTKDEEEDQIVLRAEELLQNSAPLDGTAHFHRTKLWIRGLRQQAAEAPEAYQAYTKLQKQYWSALENVKTTDKGLSSSLSIPSIFLLAIGAPIAFYGWLNNIVAAYIPKIVCDKLDLYEGYRATVKVLCGLLSFPILYTLQTILATSFLDIPWWAYFLSLPLSGWLYLKWAPLAALIKAQFNATRIKQPGDVRLMRAELLKMTNQYLNS